MTFKELIAFFLAGALLSCSSHPADPKETGHQDPLPKTESRRSLSAVEVPGIGGTDPRATQIIPKRRNFPLNSSVNPCEDFFQYACSKAIAHFKLREDRSNHVFAFNDSDERLLETKMKYLDGISKSDSLPKGRFTSTLRTVFKACMNQKASAQEEREAVLEWAKKILNFKTREEFLAFSGEQIDSGHYAFLSMETLPNLDRVDQLDFLLLGNLQTLPERSYYDNQELMKDWKEVLILFFQTLGIDHPEDRAQSVMEFEKAFAQTFPLPAEFRQLAVKRTRIDKQTLLEKYPFLSFKKILSRVPEQTLIRDLTPDNFAWLNHALETADLEVLKNVYLYHQLESYLDDAYSKYFLKDFEFNKKYLGGPNQRPPRRERCARNVMNNLTKELDYELLPTIFPHFPTERFIAMSEKIRESIIKGVRENEWLTPEGKEGALEKIKKARLQLVKPGNEREWDFKPPADYSSQRRHTNNQRIRKFLLDKQFNEMQNGRNLEAWHMGPLTLNAYYSRSDNRFTMPIGILQYPFYDSKLSDTANLAAAGFVMGHELGHAIDDVGARFDAEGKLRQWMPDKDVVAFREHGARLIDQFNSAGINGQLTLGENIGDLVGLRFAYQAAFPTEMKASLPEKREFFLQYARVWCGVMRPLERERLLKTNPHSPIEARVNEQMKHQPGFEEAFSCKAGERMVLPPSQRVRVW